MDKKLKEKLEEKVLDLKVEREAQKASLEALKELDVKGAQAQQIGQAISNAEFQYKLVSKSIENLEQNIK